MTDDISVNIWINPLAFTDVDHAGKDEVITPESVLEFLCTPSDSHAVGALIERYKRISANQPQIFGAPTEPRLLERLIWPLRHAKGSFVVGNYLGTISLCGMVSEMVALLLFDFGEFRLNNQVMDERGQRALFGREFEKLGQERRVEILAGYGILNDKHKAAFNAVRERRRKYLHL